MEINIKKYNILSDCINVLYIIGYITDFVVRKTNLDYPLKFIATIPFLLNFIIIFYLLFQLFKNKNTQLEYRTKLSSIIIRLTLNLLFLLLIIIL
jgi:hypothetical protein